MLCARCKPGQICENVKELIGELWAIEMNSRRRGKTYKLINTIASNAINRTIEKITEDTLCNKIEVLMYLSKNKK